MAREPLARLRIDFFPGPQEVRPRHVAAFLDRRALGDEGATVRRAAFHVSVDAGRRSRAGPGRQGLAISSRLLVFGKVVPNLDSELPLSELDGLTIWHQTRLEEEDVENAFNMTNADLITLTVNTKIPPERLVDWIDQAILYVSIGRENDRGTDGGDLRTRLAALGIGTASALLATIEKSAADAQLRTELNDRLPRVQAAALVARVERFGNIALIEHRRAQHRRAMPGEDAHIDRPPVLAELSPCNGSRSPLGRLAALT